MASVGRDADHSPPSEPPPSILKDNKDAQRALHNVPLETVSLRSALPVIRLVSCQAGREGAKYLPLSPLELPPLS